MNATRARRRGTSIAALALALVAGGAVAGPLEERFALVIEGSVADFDTEIRADSARLGRGTRFRFEDELGLDESDRFLRAEARWRFAPRHALSLRHLGAERERSARLRREIAFAGERFALAADVTGAFEVRSTELLYRWAALDRESVRIELLGGIHRLALETRLRGRVAVDGQQAEFDGAASARAAEPLPVIGLAIAWAPAPRWRVEFDVEALQAEVGDIEGHLVDAGVTVSRRFGDHLEVGFGYHGFDLDLRLVEREWRGELAFTHHGPALSLGLRF